jgi:hypothetical protein
VYFYAEPSINVGIINSITRLHLVGYFYWLHAVLCMFKEEVTK